MAGRKAKAKSVQEDVSVAAPLVSKMSLCNPSTSPRSLVLSSGIVRLMPGEVRRVPDSEAAEIRTLFKTKLYQRLVDNGLLRFTESAPDSPVDQPTPAPPEDLTNPVAAGGIVAGANSETKYDPASGEKMKAAGSVDIV